MTTSKAAPKKAPQDRKPKAEKAEPIVRPQDVPGFTLLKSIDEVPVWDQAPLLALVHELMGDAEPGDEVVIEEDRAIHLMGEIAKAMIPWAIDQKEFTKFCSGKDAIQKVMNLSMAWVSALGEDESSDDS